MFRMNTATKYCTAKRYLFLGDTVVSPKKSKNKPFHLICGSLRALAGLCWFVDSGDGMFEFSGSGSAAEQRAMRGAAVLFFLLLPLFSFLRCRAESALCSCSRVLRGSTLLRLN
jgi:hypothetical protein